MPRSMRKPTAPGVRSDGELTAGTTTPVGSGQPNGQVPRSNLVQAAAVGAGARPSYGEVSALRSAIADTPVPPNVQTHAVAARVAAHHAGLINPQGQLSHPNVTPLFAPTERPWEPVTAGAPMDAGPTNPMAMAPMTGGGDSPNVVLQLEQAADASGSPILRKLAARAEAMFQPGSPGSGSLL